MRFERILLLLIALCAGCVDIERRIATQHEEHPAGAGTVVTLGNEQYHAALVIDEQGKLRLFALGADPSRVIDVPQQVLTAYVRSPDETAATAVMLTAERQAGDAPGKTSQFVGQLPDEMLSRPLMVEIASVSYGYDRFRVAASIGVETHDSAMPAPLASDREQELFLNPGGRYTAADIEANNRAVPSEVYRDFEARHDLKPRSGDPLCPITQTLANAECTWVIDGQTYLFCCPPCIGELVKLAKERPDELQSPEDYVQREE